MTKPTDEKRIFCVRNQIPKSPEEHLACPYCFGQVREVIEQGELRHFCDYDPQRDPMIFGFPTGSGRNSRG